MKCKPVAFHRELAWILNNFKHFVLRMIDRRSADSTMSCFAFATTTLKKYKKTIRQIQNQALQPFLPERSDLEAADQRVDQSLDAEFREYLEQTGVSDNLRAELEPRWCVFDTRAMVEALWSLETLLSRDFTLNYSWEGITSFFRVHFAIAAIVHISRRLRVWKRRIRDLDQQGETNP